ncbi:MAG: DUF4124 domain-containing protein [Gammaproteobacteria bacterium]|nr:hypothetical protein [Chromatiales bacterium]MDP6673326.1 DUF4124 domain-containing protein [Gammaproteobacteria bacterium]
MRAIILLTGIVSLCVMSNSAAQVIYKWIDADDVTHFSAQPPSGVDVERTSIKIRQTNRQALADRTKATSERNAAVATRKQHEAEQAAEDKTQAEKDQSIRADNCAKAKTRLLTYNSARRLYRPLENGEREYLTDEELDNERAEAQKLVNEWCD